MVPYDVHGPQDNLVELLRGIDVVITAVNIQGLFDQIPLATAAKAAGVKRFVPTAYAPVVAPNGVVGISEKVGEVPYRSWLQICEIRFLTLA